MPLMSLVEWQRKTTKVGKDRKNPLITDIDILLGEYHKVGKTDVQKLKLVILIRRYCREWLSDPGKVKKAQKKSSFRQQYVQGLLDETTNEINGPAMAQGMQQMKDGKQTGQPITKNMEEHSIELLQPRATAKGKWQLKANIQLSRSSAPQVQGQWDQHNVGKPMDQADVVNLLDFVQDKKNKGMLQRDLQYLQKKDRVSFELRFSMEDSRCHRGGSGNPHSSPNGEKEMYAIDGMELIYTANQPAKAGAFHHSSFLSGRPVLCAGEIELQQGMIRYIDNGSGHYKPTTQHLLDCIQVLKRCGVAYLDKIKIYEFANQGTQWTSALDFLRYNGQKRPLPTPPPSTGGTSSTGF